MERVGAVRDLPAALLDVPDLEVAAVYNDVDDSGLRSADIRLSEASQPAEWSSPKPNSRAGFLHEGS